ncbi:PREDICTED: uncharacterized protein LOC109218590 [Nicotiana attenuata]|uniref:uncharacterized protein LOC109218590 n=1 Tax=Nicotiana attenuata TaxID=49451 RepID=UPI0009057A77|nr:PREDICTED: uncharacterized protein LOC109218590 [Nicotiana attenuata]
MQGLGGQVSVAYKDLCLFPDVQLPAGFKMPKFDLYDGHGDPVAHLRGFCSKMRGAGGKDELLMAYFSQRLSGSALEWYTRQDHGRWYTWDDLAQAFACHFQYNLEIVPDRLSLIKLEKKPGESFREYGFRWREQAARVDPPMKESEMVDYFLQALEPTYFGHLVNAIGKSFNEVVKMGGMVEEGLKSNKIMSYSAIKATTQAIQSGTGGVLRKKKKEEVATVESGAWSRSRGPSPYYNQPRPHHQNYPYTLYIPPQHYYPPPDPHFSVHHAQTYTQPPAHAQWRAPAPHNSYPAPQNPYPPPRAYRNPPKRVTAQTQPSKMRDYRSKRLSLRWEHIDTHRIEVQAPDSPNINQNPLPAHHEAHMIEFVQKGWEPKKPSQMLKGADSKPDVVAKKGSSSIAAVKPEPIKVVIQRVANKPVVVVKGARIEPVIIKPVTQLPVTNSKAIPCSYEQVVVTYKGKEIKEQVCEAQGLTRSGRCFTPEELRKARVSKDNPVLVKKAVTEEEAEEFLKKMKVQDYSIVEQLRKHQARSHCFHCLSTQMSIARR